MYTGSRNSGFRMKRDPIELEILRISFTRSRRKWSAALRRTAFSPNIKERRDYSAPCLTATARSSMATHAVHLGSMPCRSCRVADRTHAGRHGDVNRSFAVPAHLPDYSPWWRRWCTGAQRAFLSGRPSISTVGITRGITPMSVESDPGSMGVLFARTTRKVSGSSCENNHAERKDGTDEHSGPPVGQRPYASGEREVIGASVALPVTGRDCRVLQAICASLRLAAAQSFGRGDGRLASIIQEDVNAAFLRAFLPELSRGKISSTMTGYWATFL